MSYQKPHRIQQREARRISGEEGISYQAALTRVRAGAPEREEMPVPLKALLDDVSVVDICLKRYDEVYFYGYDGEKNRVDPSPFRSDDEVLTFLKRIFAAQIREMGGFDPTGEAQLSGGHRIVATLPPVSEYPAFTIRAHRRMSNTITLGYPELDDVLSPRGGAHEGQLMLLRGKSGSGKSRWMMKVLVHLARSRKNTLFVPLEFATVQALQHVEKIAKIQGVDEADLDSITFGPNERLKGSGPMSPVDIEAALIDTRKRKNISAVFIDTINYLQPSNPDHVDEEKRKLMVARELFELAKKHHVFILVSDHFTKMVPPYRHYQDQELAQDSIGYTAMFDYIVQVWRLEHDFESGMGMLSLDKNRYGPGVKISVPLFP